jgi:KaiC/GvpD/RAD55 family RecA-like ATPase
MIIDFGIPEIDELLGRYPDEQSSGMSATEDETLSACIVGADGTGKSVLALHLASRYASRYTGPVVYFSEDLGFKRAVRVFDSFALRWPKLRCAHLDISDDAIKHDYIHITPVDPDREPADNDKAEDLRRVQFIDLHPKKTGNDWTRILKFVAGLEQDSKEVGCVIIDNVDALQLVNAGVDEFGEERTRWSRLGQLINLAKKRCHLILVSGEPGAGKYLDEQYAVDYVIHLRMREAEAGYSRRSIEIEKARGQVNVGGQHAFVFRSGAGATTGYQENPDYPTIEIVTPQILEDGTPVEPPQTDKQYLSHVRVYHSLDFVYSKNMKMKHEGVVPGRGTKVEFARLTNLNSLILQPGLCGGAVGAIIGPRKTFKGQLMTAFQAGCLKGELARPAPRSWRDVIGAVRRFAEVERAYHESEAKLTPEQREQKRAELAELYFKYRTRAQDILRGRKSPIVVDLTTDDVDSWQVAYRIARWIHPARPDERDSKSFEKTYGTPNKMDKVALAAIESRLICRRFEVHANTPALLFALIRDCVDAGIRRCFNKSSQDLLVSERKEAGRVVVTIGDWAQIEERQPEVAADTKFLPLLLFHLKRQGVTSLISESRADRRALPSVYQSESRLAQDVDQTIYTWRVVGDSRVAIAAVPQQPFDGRTVVREVRADQEQSGLITVNTSLERYQGFDTGDPRPVKLRIRLLGQTPGERLYATEMRNLLQSIAESVEQSEQLVEATEELQYSSFRDVTHLIGDLQLTHTLLFMLDEFWEARESLYGLEDYLDSEPEDIRAVQFFPRGQKRRKVFEAALPQQQGAGAKDKAGKFTLRHTDRIPYTWDFGFILAHPDAWRQAYMRHVPRSATASQGISILKLEEMLRFAEHGSKYGSYRIDTRRSQPAGLYGWASRMDRLPDGWPKLKDGDGKHPASDREYTSTGQHDILGWRLFLEACCHVAQHSGNRGLRPFDIDLTATETLTATVLEIWFSEIRHMASRAADKTSQFAQLSEQIWQSTSDSRVDVIKLLGNRDARMALFFALRLLAEVLESDMLQPTPDGFDIAPRRPFPAVAVRHWYSTAVRTIQEPDVPPYTPIRLPGHFSTRGDWSLGIARGSKSTRLGYDALDLFSSVRANFERMQFGVGLPTRDLFAPDYIRTALAIPRPGAILNATYSNFITIGATNLESFKWLYRSNIAGYRSHSTPLRKWIFRVLQEWVRLRTEWLSEWQDTFQLYDRVIISADGAVDLNEIPGFVDFQIKVDSLITLLRSGGSE